MDGDKNRAHKTGGTDGEVEHHHEFNSFASNHLPSVQRPSFAVHHLVIATCLLCVMGQRQHAIAADDPLSATQIDRAILQLGDPSFEVRERASQFLWRAGFAAEAVLAKAAQSDDLETAKRARQIHEKTRLGITPDMPADLARLIEQFHRGDPAEKVQAWKALLERREFDIVLRLLETTSNSPQTDEMMEQLAIRIDDVVSAMLLKGDLAQVEQTLKRFSPRSSLVRDHYLAYLLASGRIDQRLRELINADSTATDAGNSRLLAYLYRATGEWQKALAAAEQARDDRLMIDLLVQERNWGELARRWSARETQTSISGLSHLAFFEQHAGDRAGCRKSLDRMRELYNKPGMLSNTRSVTKALQLHEFWDDAVNVLSTALSEEAFDLLAAQGRWREAFHQIGLVGRGQPVAWYGGLKEDSRLQSSDFHRVQVGLRGVRGLYVVGERDAAATLLEELRREDLKRPQWLDVCHMAAQAGWHELALKQAAEILFIQPAKAATEFVPPGRVFEALFHKQATRALVLWHVLCEKSPNGDRWEMLRQVRALMSPRFARELESVNVTSLLGGLEFPAKLLETRATPGINRTSWPSAWMQSFAETALLYGDTVSARRYYERWADVTSSVEPLLHVGDLWANDREWERAAEVYAKAVERDPRDALARYLHGDALQKLGRISQADAEVRLATLLPLGNMARRHTLAIGLARRNLSRPARQQFLIVQRLGPLFGTEANPQPLVLDAAQRSAILLSTNAPSSAADEWETLAIGCLHPLVNLGEPDAYAKIAHVTHRLRAAGHLTAGRTSAALDEAVQSLAALPTQVQLAIDLVPEFERHDRFDLADELFSRQYATLETLLADFPKHAGAHNDLAWLATQCRRRLPESLGHAHRAVELGPDQASFLDTLAEVQYQTGNRELALSQIRRCLELEPRNVHYRSQQARFEANAR